MANSCERYLGAAFLHQHFEKEEVDVSDDVSPMGKTHA
jgi:hypothetical protein